jgi:hypothetical protein
MEVKSGKPMWLALKCTESYYKTNIYSGPAQEIEELLSKKRRVAF